MLTKNLLVGLNADVDFLGPVWYWPWDAADIDAAVVDSADAGRKAMLAEMERGRMAATRHVSATQSDSKPWRLEDRHWYD